MTSKHVHLIDFAAGTCSLCGDTAEEICYRSVNRWAPRSVRNARLEREITEEMRERVVNLRPGFFPATQTLPTVDVRQLVEMADQFGTTIDDSWRPWVP